VRRLFLALFLPLLLAGCVETEARLVWGQDGRMTLYLDLKGPGVSTYGDALRERLSQAGFFVRPSGEELHAEAGLKPAGWDRLSGWIPGRFSYKDPSGLTFFRVSYVLFEDYGLSGALRPSATLGLPPFAGGLPFRFVVEAPFTPIASNAPQRSGRTLVWRGTLAGPIPVYVRYRLWYPERGLLLLAILVALALWRRSRRPRAG